MFVILRVNETPGGFLKAKKQQKALAKVPMESVSTKKGLPFFVLDIPARLNDAAWLKISEKCGRYVSRIVAPRNLSLPDLGKLKRFVPSFMPSVLIFNTALETVKNAASDPTRFSITLTDRNALHHSRVHRLLPLSSTVRVVTSHPEKYASACKKAFDEYGASIIIRSAYEPCAKPDIVICSDGGASALMKSAAVISDRPVTAGKLLLHGNGIDLTAAHKEIIPSDIDPMDFAGAVTELCGSNEYKNAVFANVFVNCNICDKTSPAECLGCYIDGRL